MLWAAQVVSPLAFEVASLRPQGVGVVARSLRSLIAEAYQPEALYRRYAYNAEHTYPNRLKPPASPARASWANLRKGVRVMANLVLRVGLLADYRHVFWRMAAPLLREGRIEDVIRVGLVAHHLITFARKAAEGAHNASFYSSNNRRLAW